MQTGSALDLRAAPLSLQIPNLQEQQRHFKVSPDVWHQQQNQSRMSPREPSPVHNSSDPLPSDMSALQGALSSPPSAMQQGTPGQASTPTQPPASSTPDHKIMTEKLVNEIQQSRTNQSISERTLEECWSTLQRIFMHKNAMHMHARELQRGLAGVPPGGDVKPHQCQQCLKSFSSNHQLVQHIRVHTGEKPYKCSYCDRRFKQLSHVQQHTRLHTGERPYKCHLPDCGRAFIQLSNLQQHLRHHDAQSELLGERPYKCHLPDCGRAFIQLSNLQQHLRNHDAQVERAKNRPFHCNICGKGFATESSLRTHTAKVGHQHAALMIGGPNATPCPICHKLIFGGEALVEHMKNTHKDPNASGVASPPATSPYPTQIKPTDPYIAKRRTANHPCPVCGKHYVNEGSLRKHLACHPETQLTSNLRMWPCSVCQAVFTHESGLLSHMEHMRMEPKHQFAAQYVLSRAAAERRERESALLAAAVSASGSGLLSIGAGPGGVQTPMCPSPSAHSDSSSGGGRLSSAGSEPGSGLLNNNNNCASKLSDILRNAGNNGHIHQQYGVEDLHNANRMAAIAAAAAGIMGQTGAGGLGSPGVDSNAAVQAAAASLAAAMRINNAHMHQQQQQQQQQQHQQDNAQGPASTPPVPDSPSAVAQAALNAVTMRASMADTMMRNSIENQISQQQHGIQHPQHSPEAAALRMHQAEALLRSQAEAAIRLAVSQAAAAQAQAQAQAHAQANNGDMGSPLRHHNGNFNHQQHQDGPQHLQQPNLSQHQHASQLHAQNLSPDLTEAFRIQEHRLEQALRLHGGDPRVLGFNLTHSPSPTMQQHQQNQLQSPHNPQQNPPNPQQP